jgi:hypothetical protein
VRYIGNMTLIPEMNASAAGDERLARQSLFACLPVRLKLEFQFAIVVVFRAISPI